MELEVRQIERDDVEEIVEFSLRAWEPVYESLERVLGSEIFLRLHPDWREDLSRAVREVCDDSLVWVAESGGAVVGFVATKVFDADLGMGEISDLGVHPDHQNEGIGTTLTEFAVERMREAGMRVAMVETGGDPGHAPARRTYERSGFRELPISRYFKSL